jgi:hypothetical protein
MIAMVGLLAGAVMVSAGVCLAQEQMDPWVLELARIKVKMTENLTRLPNYTCTQVIERSVRRAGSRKFELLDTVRLDVAVVEGKELFAWPGAGRFEDREIRELVHGGAIGNGNFALHSRAIFMGSAPVFRFSGKEVLGGRTLLRFDYTVAQFRSGFTVRVGEATAVVGYHGAVWADAESHEASRLEVHADDIPPRLGLKSTGIGMDYSRMRIGESDFLLPAASEMTMVDNRGTENRNRVHFSACRQYAGESVISFGDPPPSAPAPKPAPAVVELPSGIQLNIELRSNIDARSSAVGDPVTGVLARDVRSKGRLLAPKGALVSGRVAMLERRRGYLGRMPAPYYLVGVEFDTLESDLGRAEFTAVLDEVRGMALSAARPRGAQPAIVRGSGLNLRPGVGVFQVWGDTIRIGSGTQMIWTVDQRSVR